MTKLTVSFVRQVMNEFHNEEISFSRMVEKLNEEARRIERKNDIDKFNCSDPLPCNCLACNPALYL